MHLVDRNNCKIEKLYCKRIGDFKMGKQIVNKSTKRIDTLDHEIHENQHP